MKKTINFCGNCPFSYADYDDWAVGYSTANVCTLAQFLKLNEYLILVSDGDEELKTPEWCPLKTEEFTFNFKEFSTKRKDEIDSTWKEIEELNNLYVNEDEDYDSPKVIERDNRLGELYDKFGKLQSNEEETFDQEEFQNDLSKQIDAIKEHLSTLEDVSNKLQQSLDNFGE